MSKPKLFIGSSIEGLEIAYSIQENLKFVAETTVWDQGVFNLSESSLESLLSVLQDSDFGAFVFSPDDHIKIRGKKDLAVRDNVLFELGLFLGKLGRKRCFIIIPDNKEFHLPTDLIGMTPAKYEASRSDNNLQAGTGSACHKIREAINKQGLLHNINDVLEDSAINSIKKEDKTQEWVDYLFLKKDYDKTITILKKKIRYTKDIDKKVDLKQWLCYTEFKKNPSNGFISYENLIKEHDTHNVSYIAYASQLYWNNSFKKALEITEEGLRKCERKITLTNLKAKCLWSLGKQEDAIQFLKDSLLPYDDEILYVSLIDYHLEKKDTKSAIELLQASYFSFPNSEDIKYKFAKTAYDTNQTDLCIFLYKELLDLKPDNSTYWCLLGNAYLDLKFNNLAVSAYEKAADLSNHKEGWIYANLGNIFNNLNLYNKAESYLKKALDLNDKDEYSHGRLSSVYKSKEEEIKKVEEIIAKAKEKINSNLVS